MTIQRDVQALSLEEKVGQVLCLGWDATTTERADCVNAHARAIVEEMQAGAVVLMGRNLAEPEETRAMIAELQQHAGLPLFVAVDQEGGVVNRFGPPFHAFPGNMALGAIAAEPGSRVSGEAYAEQQGRAQARELCAVGVNWNFAPVVDVNNNPDNPIIGVRSFGEDPQRVAALGEAMLRGYQQNGVLACAKHFPGHGDTSVDSHRALPTVSGRRERLDAVELLPFRALIQAGVGAIMTSHILFPALDAERPATLSPAVLTGLLRNELQFDGLIITDCLEMHAISRTVGTAQGALLALQAGADMALICHTLKTQRQTRKVLLDAVRSGALPMARLDQAAGRVLAAKQRFVTLPSESNRATVSALPAYLDPEHDILERDIARASITIVRRTSHLPLHLEPSEELLVLAGNSAGERLSICLRQHHANTTFLLCKKSDAAFREKARQQIAQAKYVVAATLPPEAFSNERVNASTQAEMVRQIHTQIGERLIVLALREPYDLRHFPAVQNYVCSYGHRPCSLKALADALFGVYPPTGCLPVTIPGVA